MNYKRKRSHFGCIITKLHLITLRVALVVGARRSRLTESFAQLSCFAVCRIATFRVVNQNPSKLKTEQLRACILIEI